MLTMLSDVLTGPEKWAKGMTFGRHIAGVLIVSSQTEKWDCCCLIGACHLTDHLNLSLEACVLALNELGFGPRSMPTRERQAKHPIALFNDHADTTWDDVSAVIQRADFLMKEPV